MVGDDSASIKSEELLREQAHFDEAAEQRAKTLEKLDQLPKNTAHPGAAKAAVTWSRATMASIGNVDDPVAFGRTDNDEHETYYIGKHPIWDEGTELLVVSWKAPIATAFYSATAANPNGLERKRQFNMDRNSILDFADIIFGDLSEQLRPLLEEAGGSAVVGWVETYEQDDVLLRELGRNRTGRMVDIVATIQAAQFELVTSASEGLLIIEGGPGTGKTVVALHRVSWLLWPDESKKLLNPEDFLVVGPSATFMSYIKSVLPDLGDADIAQRSIKSLYSRPGGLRMEREESIEQSRLKGDLQMQNLIDADLAARIRLPDQEDLEVKLGGRTISLEREEVKRQIDQLRDQKYLDGRMVFRERLHDLALQAHQSSGGLAIFEQRAEIDLSAVDNLVDRIWPQLTPPQYLRELLNSRDRLLDAAGSEFSAYDVRLLHRSRAERLADETWSDSDIALLDYVEHRLRGHQQYVHLVVDEAQDLSPMQLLMLANRSRRGSATVLGDIAQSTGAWARDDWNDVIAILGKGGPHSIHPLQYGYRVPREVYEYAARLLPSIAPGVVPPEVIRDVGRDPEVREINSGGTGAEVAEVVKSYSAIGLYIGVICPRSRWGDVAGAFTDKEMQFCDSESEELVQGQNINLIDPVAAKGLEFDAVVVVEPSAIVEEYERGDRLLYVALTRTMKYLTVVHELPLPASLQDDPEANALADRYDTDGLDPDGAGAGNDRIEEPLPVEVVPTDTVPVLSGPVSIWAERLAQTIDQHLSSQHHSALLIDVIRQLGVEDLVAGRLLADRQTGTLSAESAESADTRQSAAAEWPDLDTPMSVGRGGLHDSWLEGYGYWACHQMKPWREIKLPFGSLRSALFGPSGARALFAGSTKKMRDKVDSHGPVEVVVVRLGDVAVVTDGSLVVSVPWLELSRSNPDAIVSLVGSTPGCRNLNEASFT